MKRDIINKNGQEPIIKVVEGLVEGFCEDQIFKFYGIPFAEPPVGKLRWRSPQPLNPWAGIIKASKFGRIAYQIRPPGPLDGERMPVQSEDCLYLNIWTPSVSEGANLPVMVWIHGGGFMVGSGSTSDCDGTVLAQQGVIVVSFNYRLGPLGNIIIPGLEDTAQGDSNGNYGIKDQIAALRWIQNNIESFGGDKQNVTIFGVSAGAMSVALLCSSPKAEGLFCKAICQSGGSLAPPRENSYEVALQDGYELQKALGASDIDAMRNIRPEKLMDVARKLANNDEQPMKLRFAPALDEVTIRDQRKTLREKAKIPIITGSNRDEATYFLPMMSPITLANYELFVHRSFGDKAAKILNSFPSSSDEEALKNFIYLHTCSLFTMPTYKLAEDLKKLGGIIYVYRFSRLSPKNIENGIGVSHGEEVPYVFGHVNVEGYTKVDCGISQMIMRYWVQFSRTGNPNQVGLPEWPGFTPELAQYIEFGDSISTKNYLEEQWFKILC